MSREVQSDVIKMHMTLKISKQLVVIIEDVFLILNVTKSWKKIQFNIWRKSFSRGVENVKNEFFLRMQHSNVQAVTIENVAWSMLSHNWQGHLPLP